MSLPRILLAAFSVRLDARRVLAAGLIAATAASLFPSASAAAQPEGPAPLMVDIDGDGIADSLVVEVGFDAAAPRAGRITAVSGATGQTLYVIDGAALNDRFGHSVRIAPLQGSGPVELLVSAPGATADAAGGLGRIEVFAAATGVWSRTISAPAATRIGMAFDLVADQDGDGWREVIVEGAIQGNSWQARTFVFSGRTGALLATRAATLGGLRRHAEAGGRVYLAADLDDNGIIDVRDVAAVAAGFAADGGLEFDVNRDGVVDSADLAAVVEALLRGDRSIVAAGLVTEVQGEAAAMRARWSEVHGVDELGLTWSFVTHAAGAEEEGEEEFGGTPSASSTGDGGGGMLPGLIPCACEVVPGNPAAAVGGLFGCPGYMMGCPGQSLPIGTAINLAPPGSNCTFVVEGDAVSHNGFGALVAVQAGCVTVTMRCTDANGACCACQICSICVYEQAPPCETMVGFLNCPAEGGEPTAIDALGGLVLLAEGLPESRWIDGVQTWGVYDWAVHVAGCDAPCATPGICPDCPDECPVVYGLTTTEGVLRLSEYPGFAALTPTDGQCLWVRVRYRHEDCDPDNCCLGPLPCCHAVATCAIPLYARNPSLDTDGDGYCDWEENRGGSNLNDPTSMPADRLVDLDGDNISKPADVRGPVEYRPAPFSNPPWEPVPYRERFDTDNDGVQDLAELALGLDPLLAFTTPGTPDRYTAAYLLADKDQDLVFDVFEGMLGLDPAVRDTDGDGIIDGIELRAGTDPRVSHRHESPDSDGDGLSDYEEVVFYGTDPQRWDTDGDGLGDFFEVRAGLNPRSAYSNAVTTLVYPPGGGAPFLQTIPGPHDAAGDTDFDGLSNLLEQVYGTDPTLRDSDGDGVSDGEEFTQGSNPADPSDGGLPPVAGEEVCWVLVTINGGHHDDAGCGPGGEWDDPRRGPGSGLGIGAGGMTDEKLTNTWTVTIGWGGDGSGGGGGGGGSWTIPTGPSGERTTLLMPLRRGRCYDISISGRRRPGWGHDAGYFQVVPVDVNDLDPQGRPRVCSDCCCMLVDNSGGAMGNHCCFPGEPCWNPDGPPARTARICLPLVDLDIGLPANEEDVEGTTGRVIGVNDDDTDGDGVVDYADGFDLRGDRPEDDQTQGEQFATVTLKVGGLLTPPNARIVLDYSASAPAAVVVAQTPSGAVPVLPATGTLRLWKAVPDSPRNKLGVSSGGDFVEPNYPYTLEELGFSGEGGQVTLWVEAVRPSEAPGDRRIEASVSGVCASDAVRLTSPKLELVTWNEATGEVSPAHPLGSFELPRPTVELQVAAPPQLDAQQNLLLGLHWRVRDQLSDLAGDPADRVQRLIFTADGREIASIDDLAARAQAAGTMPWQPHNCDLEGFITLTIPPPSDDSAPAAWNPGTVVVRVMTTPNAAQEVGWDQIGVRLVLIEDSDATRGPHWFIIGEDTGLCSLDCSAATPSGPDHLVGIAASVRGSYERTVTGAQPSYEFHNLADSTVDEVPCGACVSGIATTALQSDAAPTMASGRYAVAIHTQGTSPVPFPLGVYGCESAPAAAYTASNNPPPETIGPFIEVLHAHSPTVAVVVRHMLSTGESYWAAWTGAFTDLGSSGASSALSVISGCPFPLTFQVHLHYTDDAGTGGTTINSSAVLTIGDVGAMTPPGGARFALVVDGWERLPASPRAPATPILLRIPALTDEAAERLSVAQSDEPQTLEPFTFSPTKHYVVVPGQGRPRILVVTVEALPAGMEGVTPDRIATVRSRGELKYELLDYSGTVVTSASITLLEDSPDLQRTIGRDEDIELTPETVLWWYQLIYGGTQADGYIGLRILDYYFRAGGVVRTEDLWFSSYRLTDPLPINPGDPDVVITIDEDVRPDKAAALLYSCLQRAIAFNDVRAAMHSYHADPDIDIEAITASYRAIGPAAARIGATYANAYLSGVSIVFDTGGDIAFVIHDLGQGKWGSAATGAAFACLPFVPARFFTGGAEVVIKATPGGPALFGAAADGVAALGRAANQVTTLGKYNQLRPHYPQVADRLNMAKAGQFGEVLHPDKCREVARTRKLDPSSPHYEPRPSGDHVLHHDCPVEYQEWFLAHGIDINEPEFTRWVQTDVHASYLHSRAPPFDAESIRQQMIQRFGIDETTKGGMWNTHWLVFMRSEDVLGSGYTREQVLQKIQDLRRDFPLD